MGEVTELNRLTSETAKVAFDYRTQILNFVFL